jgi:hypothetical protein
MDQQQIDTAHEILRRAVSHALGDIATTLEMPERHFVANADGIDEVVRYAMSALVEKR